MEIQQVLDMVLNYGALGALVVFLYRELRATQHRYDELSLTHRRTLRQMASLPREEDWQNGDLSHVD